MIRKVSSIAFKITAVYAVTSVVWILLSDRLLNYFVSDPVLTMNIAIVKGWFFVVITAGLLYQLIFKHMSIIVKSEQKLQEEHEIVMSAYEELIAQEEELKQQFDEILNREEQISRRNECLYALHEASLVLVQEHQVEDPFAIVVKKMMAMSGAQFGYIYLLDKNDMLMKSKVIDGFSREEIKKNIKKGEGLIGQVWETGETLVIDHYHEWEKRLLGMPYDLLRSAIGLPLKVGGEVIGVFSMNYIVDHVFDKEERFMLDSFAELASIALVNLLLHEDLQASQKRNQALVNAFPDSIFQLDHRGTLLDYKKGKELEWAMDIQGKIGEKIENFLPHNYSSILMEKIEKTLETENSQVFEYQQLHQGMVKYQEVRMVKSGVNEVIAITREITTRKEMECKLQYYALHDKVTGLYNRSYFEEKIKQLTDSRQVPIGLIMCDIDGLKLVNDTFGHQAGDELLISAVGIIESCLTEMDEVARVGGDEFAILLPGKDQVEVEEVCHRIRESIIQFRKENIKIPMSISLGVGLRSQPEQSMVDVFKIADDNMYREKLHSSQSIRSSIVQTLAKALEARDFVTGGHADRLQYLIVELAMALGLSDSRLSDLRLFGRFHDIGKVGIPDEILFKPGRLDKSEFEVMKRHCEIGYRIAQSSGDLSPIADWILKHQEWWNGQGYPLGIKGEEIPLACRMLSIVDAYDAMTNDRPYRTAMCHEDAIVEIERCAGTQFDPKIVEIFKHIVTKTLEFGLERQQVIMNEIAAMNYEFIDRSKNI